MDHNHISAKIAVAARSQNEFSVLASSFGLTYLRIDKLGWADFFVPSGTDFFTVARALKNNNVVENVDLLGFIQLAVVNDPFMNVNPANATITNSQWSLKRFNMENVWQNYGYGNISGLANSGPIVAVFDTGLDITHPDIGSGTGANAFHNLWTNQGEIPNNGLDDDNNGVADDIHGAFFDVQNSFPSANISDQNNQRPSHGTHVSGIIAAKTNNGLGVAGLAGGANGYGARIMTVKIYGENGIFVSSIALNDAILYAVDNGAKILNMSIVTSESESVNQALNYAFEKGVLIIAAGGNINYPGEEALCGNGPGVFPANHAKVFGIGNGKGAYSSPPDKLLSVFDASFWGKHIDLYAPGTEIVSTLKNNLYGAQTGTSMAAPWVSGIAALMLDLNPCLTPEEIKSILTLSATIPNINCNDEVYSSSTTKKNRCLDLKTKGYINPEKALQIVNENVASNSEPDIYIKGAADDFGKEPYSSSPVVWESPSIWVRNQVDGFENQEHENPLYSTLYPNQNTKYVYVKVQNRSCQPFSSNSGKVKLYWSKAGLGYTFPNYWDGSMSIPVGMPSVNVPVGGLIDEITLNELANGKEEILQFSWNIPDPTPFQYLGDNWHFCLMAVFESIPDPLVNNSSDLRTFLEANNNTAMKNLSIMKLTGKPGKPFISTIALHQSERVFNTQNLVIQEPVSGNTSLFEAAKVSVIFPSDLFSAWLTNTEYGSGIRIEREENRIVLEENGARIKNIPLENGAYKTIQFEVNFYASDTIVDSNFVIRLIAQSPIDESILNGETFDIQKRKSKRFKAIAGDDQYLVKTENANFSAPDLGDGFTYKWKNLNKDSAIYQSDFSVPALENTQFSLEIKDSLAGFYDADSCNLFVLEGRLNSVSPNPASDFLTVKYTLHAHSAGSLLVINNQGIVVKNMPVDPNLTERQFSVQDLSLGFYSVLLVHNNSVLDSITFSKL
jgi:subtilisin family serine protease